MLQKMLRLSVGVSALPITFDVIHSLVKHSLSSYENIIKANEGGVMETETDTDLIQYWNGFRSLVADLKSLGLLDTFINHSSAVAIRDKVKDYITCQCKDVYDESLLPDVIDKLQLILHDWLSSIYGEVTEDHKLKILYNIYTQYGELRIEELFDIIVEFPDSKPSLLDLKECLLHTDLRQKLMSSLKDVYKQRLLHHGANTSDIITQYISSIRALLILDPAGVILEHTCEPVRAYLRTREDTVNCIMASLIDDSNNDLAEELAKGEAMLLDLSDDIDDANQDFDNWVPDPIDADITKSSKSRRTTDIISILVYIYESQEMFVNEYRALLADRLLHSLNYDTTREVTMATVSTNQIQLYI
jgi:anaphase-promoting complex subunit 2